MNNTPKAVAKYWKRFLLKSIDTLPDENRISEVTKSNMVVIPSQRVNSSNDNGNFNCFNLLFFLS